MNELTATGELDNTIVMFTTDNGYLLGERIPAGKTVPYEPSTYLPLVVRGPGFPPGTTRDQLVADIDLAPTFVDAADAQSGFDMTARPCCPWPSIRAPVVTGRW